MKPREAYQRVNAEWPSPLPPLTGAEALSAAKRLYRKFRRKRWAGKWKLTSGRRHTWPRYVRTQKFKDGRIVRSGGAVYFVNPERGWHDLVHDISHYIHGRDPFGLPSDKKPHDLSHARLEREMIQYVVAQGWLAGKLKPKPKAPPAPLQERRYQRVVASIERKERQAKRLASSLKKLRAKRRYYERALAKKQPAALPSAA